MIVVPGEPQGGQAEEGVVPTFVLGPIWPGSKPVTNRVDTPDEVIHKKNANQTTPQETEQQTIPRTRGECHTQGRKKQSTERPKIIGTRGFSGYLIAEEIGGAMAPIRGIKVSEEPADVGVK